MFAKNYTVHLRYNITEPLLKNKKQQQYICDLFIKIYAFTMLVYNKYGKGWLMSQFSFWTWIVSSIFQSCKECSWFSEPIYT